MHLVVEATCVNYTPTKMLAYDSLLYQLPLPMQTAANEILRSASHPESSTQ